MRNLILSGLLALGLADAASAQQTDPQTNQDPTARDASIEFGGPDPVRIVTARGDEYEIMAEIAATPAQMERGLMWREAVEPGSGMLFHYEPAQPASMWMRHTLVDLDIVYIDPAGVVVKIIAYAQAESLRSLSSDATVAGVLELGAGQAIEMGLRPGDIVHHPFFDTVEVEAAALDDAPAAEESADEAQ
ncbi:DUF192 domain-containing protein [Maricaulis maris]|uniref:Uncharacterized membrane protein (UPF0127 family) n=1 Tax=Maricaulis maris TaxID=74318 RepID=A0A495DJQ7_9PROT|nr:DUF192 domain-containing protein [Maricaulis maris]RKR02854.1 uncharacterized membrane protein (UPF0127 family) [Maricaulis maris]